MKGTKSKKLVVAARITGVISAAWVGLTPIFHIFGDVIWEYPRPPWVGQFIFIGIVLMII